MSSILLVVVTELRLLFRVSQPRGVGGDRREEGAVVLCNRDTLKVGRKEVNVARKAWGGLEK